jgi:hypothetical protein
VVSSQNVDVRIAWDLVKEYSGAGAKLAALILSAGLQRLTSLEIPASPSGNKPILSGLWRKKSKAGIPDIKNTIIPNQLQARRQPKAKMKN